MSKALGLSISYKEGQISKSKKQILKKIDEYLNSNKYFNYLVQSGQIPENHQAIPQVSCVDDNCFDCFEDIEVCAQCNIFWELVGNATTCTQVVKPDNCEIGSDFKSICTKCDPYYYIDNTTSLCKPFVYPEFCKDGDPYSEQCQKCEFGYLLNDDKDKCEPCPFGTTMNQDEQCIRQTSVYKANEVYVEDGNFGDWFGIGKRDNQFACGMKLQVLTGNRFKDDTGVEALQFKWCDWLDWNQQEDGGIHQGTTKGGSWG